MPVYAYKGLDGRGKSTAGLRDADSAKGLRAALKREGIYLTEVTEQAGGATSKGTGMAREVDFAKLFARVTPQEVAIFTRQLATLLRAGIPLTESLGALLEQIERPKLKEVTSAVREKVNAGTSLADALAEHPKVFIDLYVNMVRAGESSGTLDQVLARLADFLDGQLKLRSKVTSALMYPAIVMSVSTVVLGVLMVAVVPKILAIFEDTGRALPWNTQLLIGVAYLAENFWWAIVLFVGLGVYLGRRWLRSDDGTKAWDRTVLKLPVFGPLVRMLALSRFTKTLGTMLRSGVPLLKSLDIVRHILGNTVLSAVVEQARDAIREGESIAAPLKRSGQFPSVVTHMISVGERSGHLEEMLDNVALAFESEVEMKIARLTTLLEPVMILGMGMMVAFVVFSILVPIMQMNEFVTQ
jgi:general secretion pathway protein F